MTLSKPINRADAFATLKKWQKELSEDAEGSATLQYELIAALLSLRSQANREGWAHWPGPYPEMIELLESHFPFGPEADRIRTDLKTIRSAGEATDGTGNCAYTELDRLLNDMVHWCLERPQGIALPKGYDFWLDVPADAVPTNAGRRHSLMHQLMIYFAWKR